jgi:hypothetical protein
MNSTLADSNAWQTRQSFACLVVLPAALGKNVDHSR